MLGARISGVSVGMALTSCSNVNSDDYEGLNQFGESSVWSVQRARVVLLMLLLGLGLGGLLMLTEREREMR